MSEQRAPILFVSHHSSKLETAEHVERALNSKGVQCWIAPRDIEPGEQWDVAIREAIAQTDAMLLLFCSSSEKSRQVKRELILADQIGKAIIPLRLERIDPGQLSYHLADSQWIDWLEQRDGVIDRIAAKAREFQGTEAFEPSAPAVVPLGPGPSAPPAPGGGISAAAPMSFDKQGQPARPVALGKAGEEAPQALDEAPARAAPPVPEPPPPAYADPGGAGSPPPPPQGPYPPGPPRGKSLMWLWLTLGGLALVGLIALAIWFFALRDTSRDDDDRRPGREVGTVVDDDPGDDPDEPSDPDTPTAPEPITQEWFAGQWADTPACNEIYTFEADGDVITSEGNQGTWSIENGTTLVIVGSEGTVRRRITKVNEDEVDSSDGPAYRCGSGP